MFQFTHPGKGATVPCLVRELNPGVSIHAPWEGCDIRRLLRLLGGGVSIHAPWEGCDKAEAKAIYMSKFQFTHPGKGATEGFIAHLEYSQVSIHAPWEGCDYPSR